MKGGCFVEIPRCFVLVAYITDCSGNVDECNGKTSCTNLHPTEVFLLRAEVDRLLAAMSVSL